MFRAPTVLLIAVAIFASACSSGETPTAQLDATPLTEDEAVALEPDAEAGEAATTTVAETTTTSTTTTTAPTLAEFEYLARGAFEVGVATFTVDDGSDRPLTVDAWFPLTEGTTGDAQQYTLLPGVYYESPSAIAADTSALADGPFPLVVYSHGSGGQRWIHSDYTEFIASHGYVVVAPDHTGNTLIERFSGAEIDFDLVAFQRPTDVTAVLDAALGTDPAEPLGVALKGALTDDVLVTGHSFGGFTSYATVSGVTTAAGTYPPDGRVDAIITLAPAAGPQLLSDELLAQVDVPHLVMVGDSDDTTPIDPNVERPWALTTGSPNYRVELAAAEHESFTDLCAYGEFLPQLEAVPEFVITAIDGFSGTSCAPTVMPLHRTQDITNTFAIRFLDEVTRGGAPLSEDEVTYDDDIIFFSK
jgi:predicted dienelactone hydrolase